MQYDVNFGRVGRAPPVAGPVRRFRLAVLGDFSGRANAGKLETGDALARRKPIAVDVDNLDDVLARMSLSLMLDLGEGGDSAAITVPLGSLDDFHPDQLVENVDLFGSLMTLRRNLASTAGFARAAKEVLSWSGEDALPPPRRRGRGGAVATDKRLSDFARLTGRTGGALEEAPVDDLVRRLVGPYISPARDARQPELTARVDDALSAAMRRVLHHPDFQAAEAQWRALDLLVRRIETGPRAQVVLYDVSAEEWAADLAATDVLEDTGLYAMLAEQPAMDANQGPFSAVVGLYGFELSPPHADLLGRMAQVAAAAGAPFVSAIDPDALQTPMEDQNPLVRQAWTALQALPAARYLGLATVRFLLRMPYGKRSDPIDAFKFEEFTREAGLSGMLWANPAAAAGLLLAQSWAKAGPKMQPGLVSVIGEVPYYVYTDPEGEQVALPCTERLWSERQTARAGSYNVMPLVSRRGRPEIRLAGTASVAGPVLAGPWAPFDPSVRAPAPPPQVPSATQAPDTDAAGDDVDRDAVVAGPTGDAAPEADVDLDAMLAGLSNDAPAADDAPAEAGEDSGDLDLDALLAQLSEEPAPAAEGETEVDLDALLASL